MRTVTGAILIVAAEQAFSHSLLIGFPNHVYARDVLVPASLVFAVGGLAFMIWGVLTDARKTPS